MFKNLFNTAKHTIIYSLGNLSIKMVGFILLPLYTTYLTTADYGLLAIIEAIAQFSIGVLSFKLSTAMLRWASVESDTYKKKQIIFTAMLSSGILIIPFVVSSFIFASYLSELLLDSDKLYIYFYYLSIYIFVEIYNSFILDLLRLKQKSVLYIIILITKLLLNLVLAIYFVAYAQIGVEGIVLSMLISSALFSFVTIPFTLKQIVFKFDIKTGKEMFIYGFPLVFSTISTMILTLADRFALKHFYSLSEVGIYNLGYKLSSIVNIVIIQSFQMGFLPIAYKMYDKEGAKEFFAKVLTYLTFVLVFSVLTLSFYSKEIILLLSKDPAYYEAYKIVPFISYTFLIKGIYYMFSLGLHFVKKTKYNSFIVLTGAVINLILNFALIPNYGIYGASIASIISSFVILVLYYYYSQREYYVNYEIKRLVILILSSVIITSSLYYINNESILIGLVIKSSILLTFPLLLFVFGFFSKTEKEKIFIIIKYFPNIGKIKNKIINK